MLNNILYTLYYNIINIFNYNTNIIYNKHIPDSKIPKDLEYTNLSLYNLGYIKGKGHKVIPINYIQRKEI